MNEKEIKQAREEYMKLLNDNKNMLISEESNKQNIIEQSFGVIAQNTKSPKNIYVFIGYYGIVNPDSFAVPLAVNNPFARYCYYVNLETLEIKSIHTWKKDSFENRNIVVYLDEPTTYHHIRFYRKKFNELRNEYFNHLIDKSQEEAVKQIIKKR